MGKTKKGGKSNTYAARMRKHYLRTKLRKNTISPEEIEELGQGRWCIRGPRMTADLMAALEGHVVIEHGRRKVNLADLLDRATGGEEE